MNNKILSFENYIQETKKAREELLKKVSDETAKKYSLFFPRWKINQNYLENDRVFFNNNLYKVVESHLSSSEEKPETSQKFIKL